MPSSVRPLPCASTSANATAVFSVPEWQSVTTGDGPGEGPANHACTSPDGDVCTSVNPSKPSRPLQKLYVVGDTASVQHGELTADRLDLKLQLPLAADSAVRAHSNGQWIDSPRSKCVARVRTGGFWQWGRSQETPLRCSSTSLIPTSPL